MAAVRYELIRMIPADYCLFWRQLAALKEHNPAEAIQFSGSCSNGFVSKAYASNSLKPIARHCLLTSSTSLPKLNFSVTAGSL
jgi:hypothetical protein